MISTLCHWLGNLFSRPFWCDGRIYDENYRPIERRKDGR
jgi:hypothetical protein